MAQIILFNKPYLVLCQFTDPRGRSTLADFIPLRGVYAAGRLDFDSEGLVLLTDSGALQHQITDPKKKLLKTYWVQVEGEPGEAALSKMEKGLVLKDGPTGQAIIKRIPEPVLWPRNPPIRFRQNKPTSWLEICISEGRKHQVRRMTTTIGHPTLRLVRIAIGDWNLGALRPGEWTQTESG